MATCKFCNKSFVKQSTLQTHICEQRRRFLAKDEKHSIIALHAFIRFYEMSSPLSDGKRTFDDFVISPFYNGFIKFGSFINNIKPLYPSKYIDWIINSGTKLDHWCKESIYDKYVLDVIYNESLETALERSIIQMQVWADNNNSSFNEYFRKANTNVIIYDIKDGKISPWLLLNCMSGQTFLSGLQDGQLSNISTVVDIKKWINIFNKNPDNITLVKQIVEASNI